MFHATVAINQPSGIKKESANKKLEAISRICHAKEPIDIKKRERERKREKKREGEREREREREKKREKE